MLLRFFFFFSSRRRHTRYWRDWSSDVCSSDLSDGFFKVSENLVQILVEEAVPAGEIDASEAESRVEEAERQLSEASEDDDREEIMRRQRVGENLVRVARRYGGEG